MSFSAGAVVSPRGISTSGARGHAHEHHHGEDVDWNAMGEVIERRAELYRPLYAQIIDAVRERSSDPDRIVDAGSGPGFVSAGLAEAFPSAEVLALDSAPALRQRAQRRARDAGLAARVDTRRGEIPEAFTEPARRYAPGGGLGRVAHRRRTAPHGHPQLPARPGRSCGSAAAP